MKKSILIAGGGTGGHLFPGIALVEEFRRRNTEIQFVFVGTRQGIEARVLPKMGEVIEYIEVKPIMGRSIAQLSRNISRLPLSILQALKIIMKYKPSLVIGLGGYAAGPALAAAYVSNIPTVLLEQNIHMGLTNRLLAPIVTRAYLTYEETAVHFRKGKAIVCGNPVRRDFVQGARMAASDPKGLEARSRRVLVTAGSQGARTINQIIPKAFEKARFAERQIHVLHQTGASMLDEVKKAYQKAGIEVDARPFIDNMAKAYASASLVISRAGATTLAEICAIGRPSILIPYPHHKDDHQADNALALVNAGAAIMVREDSLNEESFALLVSELLRDTDRRSEMADAARKQGNPDAAAKIVDDLSHWVGNLGLKNGTLGPGLKKTTLQTGTQNLNDGKAVANRMPKVKRSQLRIRTVDVSIDVAS